MYIIIHVNMLIYVYYIEYVHIMNYMLFDIFRNLDSVFFYYILSCILYLLYFLLRSENRENSLRGGLISAVVEGIFPEQLKGLVSWLPSASSALKPASNRGGL